MTSKLFRLKPKSRAESARPSSPTSEAARVRIRGSLPSVVVECADIRSEDDFWKRYLDAAQPQDRHLFGRNLNAFWDVIYRGGPGWPGEVEIVLHNSKALNLVRVRGNDRTLLKALMRMAAHPEPSIPIWFE
jgi:RNAse (barnase) inhibitor barstar